MKRFSERILTVELGVSEWLYIRPNFIAHKFKMGKKSETLISPLTPPAAFGRASI